MLTVASIHVEGEPTEAAQYLRGLARSLLHAGQGMPNQRCTTPVTTRRIEDSDCYRSTPIALHPKLVGTRNCHLLPQKRRRSERCSPLLFRRRKSSLRSLPCGAGAPQDQTPPNITRRSQVRHHSADLQTPLRSSMEGAGIKVRTPMTSSPTGFLRWINSTYCTRKEASLTSSLQCRRRNKRMTTLPAASPMLSPTKPLSSALRQKTNQLPSYHADRTNHLH